MQIDYLSNHEHLIPELAQLHFDEWGHYRLGDTVGDRAEHLCACCGKESLPTVIVGHIDSELCGNAMLVTNDMDTLPELSPWLAGVYIKAQYRRSGVGSTLVSRIVDEAMALGVPRLYLCTDGSESMYARLGWCIVRRSLYKGITVTVMARELPGEFNHQVQHLGNEL